MIGNTGAQQVNAIRRKTLLGIEELSDQQIEEFQRILDWIRTPSLKGDYILRKNQVGKWVEVQENGFRRLE